MESIRDWPSCNFLGTLIFNRKPVQPSDEPDALVQIAYNFQSCFKLCQEANRNFAFFDLPLCYCENDIWDNTKVSSIKDCDATERCVGIAFNDPVKEKGFDNLMYMPLLQNTFVFGDVLDRIIMNVTTEPLNWRTVAEAVKYFFENDQAVSTDVDNKAKIVFNDALEGMKTNCAVICARTWNCYGFHVKLLVDLTKLDVVFRPGLSIVGECAYYPQGGIKYVQSVPTPLRNWSFFNKIMGVVADISWKATAS